MTNKYISSITDFREDDKKEELKASIVCKLAIAISDMKTFDPFNTISAQI